MSSTAGTVTVPFDNATVVGDNFLRAPYNPMQTATVQLTSDFLEADASIAVGTGAEFQVIELITKDLSDEGRDTSYVLAVSGSHWLNYPT